MTSGAPDPFAHLHDESYADEFSGAWIGHEAAIAMGGRHRISLNGDWSFTPDLFDEGLRQRLFAAPSLPPEVWDRPRDFDPDGATSLAVPSCWTCAREAWRYFEGAGWYARDFDWQGDEAKRLVLRVGAANYQALVFLNGHFLAAHRGGSTPFFIELTQALQRGRNRLLIQVDNRRRPDRVPMHHFDWFNHGGLYRDVDLVLLPAVFIRRFAVGWRDGTIAVEISLSDPVTGTGTFELPALGIVAEIPVEAGRGLLRLAASPELWAPETPHLYDVSVRFGSDRVLDRVGFRDIRVEDDRILLNGQDLFLHGVCVHEDDVVLGKATNEADIRRRFAHAREMGCNFLRLAHYPHHERVAEIADEEGFLLWSEIPVYWAIDFANPDTYADAENQLLEMIARDRNRASVILWGIGNENADTDMRYAFMAHLAQAARAADPTRLVGAACLINRQDFRIEDRLADHLDVIGLNEYFGWYEPDFEGLERLLANSSPGKPVVISEVGADAVAGKHGSPGELFTEECQAEIFRRQIAIVLTAPYIRGFCPWVLYDFRSERRQTRFQRGFNRKGLIAEDKATRKLAFTVMADAYGSLARHQAVDR